MSGAEVIPIAAYLPKTAAPPSAVDLVEAWRGRRLQLLGEAELLTREFEAHAAALEAACGRFSRLAGSVRARLAEIHAQAGLIDEAISKWLALTGDGPGGEDEG